MRNTRFVGIVFVAGAFAGAGAERAHAQGAPYEVVSTATIGSTSPQINAQIAVDPSNSSNLVAAVTDYEITLVDEAPRTEYAFSSEGGAPGSWTVATVPHQGSVYLTGDGKRWDWVAFPSLAIDRSSNVYLAGSYYRDGDPVIANGLYVAVGRIEPGSPFEFPVERIVPVAVSPDTEPQQIQAKSWVAVDGTKSVYSGNVYVSWTRWIGASPRIAFSRSSDQGSTWSDAIELCPPGTRVEGSQVAVGPSGEIYVVWETTSFDSSLGQLFLVKSTDGGLTFTVPVAISPEFSEPRGTLIAPIRAFPSLAVSPTTGTVFVAYTDKPASAGAAVELIASSDGGNTFSCPSALSDAPGDRFVPAIATDAAGTLHASWYDARSGRTLYDIYATRSVDDGRTFAPETRVTPESIDTTTSGPIGQYAGIAADSTLAHPVWSNGSLATATLR